MPFNYQTVQYRSLQGRSVVITGGASGIGEEMVKAFVAQGARVSLHRHRCRKGRGPGFGNRRFVPQVRRDRYPSPAGKPGPCRAEHHGIDVLVNNAGKDDRHDMAAGRAG